MKLDALVSIPKEGVADAAVFLQPEDIAQLVRWTGEQKDDVRYKAVLLLRQRSEKRDDVYPYWEAFAAKLSSDNAFQRCIGLNLMADNAKWDTEGRLDDMFGSYLACCCDEKPIAVRMCLQGLQKIAAAKPVLHAAIVDKLLSIDVMRCKDTQRKLVLLDILGVLSVIWRHGPDERIARYVSDARTGGLLGSQPEIILHALFADGAL